MSDRSGEGGVRHAASILALAAVFVACGGRIAMLPHGDGGASGAPADASSVPADGAPFSFDPNAPAAPSYRIDPAHTSAASGSSLTPPLTQAWSVELGGVASYPLIAGGLVFVLDGSSLVALDARDGSIVWSVPFANAHAHAYDAGRVFVVDPSGDVRAFDAATGAGVWTASMTGSGAPSRNLAPSPDTVPTAYRGSLYVTAADLGGGGTLFTFDEPTGKQTFALSSEALGGGSPPALADDDLVLAYAGGQISKYSLLTGSSAWSVCAAGTACPAGGVSGEVPVIAGGNIFVTDSGHGVVLGRVLGSTVATFPADRAPAVDDRVIVVTVAGTVVAFDAADIGSTVWTATPSPDDRFTTTPVIAGGAVYVADAFGVLYAFDEATGNVVWSTTANVGAPGAGFPPPEMAAAGDLLVVPEGTRVVAFRSAGDGG
jgi:outer membrane protein assembly factor BamB